MFRPNWKKTSDKDFCEIPEASFGSEYQVYGLLE
jgi:hypothetical protein